MKYNEFFGIISNGALSGAYVLHGVETFLTNAAVNAALNSIPEGLRAFNSSVMTDPSPAELMNACETLPLMFDYRVVIVKGIASGKNTDAIVEYAQSVKPETVLLLVFEEQLQERSVILKRFPKDRVACFMRLSQEELIKWCIKTAIKQGVSLDVKTAGIIINLVGTELAAVRNELQKAIGMAGEGGVISPQIVSECITPNVEYRVFDMIDAFTSARLSDGIRALSALLEDENESLGIAAFLESRFKLILEARCLLNEGLSQDSALKLMEGSPYANKKAIAVARKYSFSQLAALVKSLANVGATLMTTGTKASLLVEQAMVSFRW